MLDQLIPFLTAAILLTLAPGPDIIYVLVQSMANGKKDGIITAAGLASGIIVHTSLVAFGVSAIIRQSENLFLAIKIFGACYLLFIAFKVYKSGDQVSISADSVPKKRNFALYRQGFIMNVLNPKVTIFFLAFFPGFLWDPNGNTVYQFYTLGILFMLQAFIIFSVVALLAGKISVYLKRHAASGKYLKWLQIIVFIGIAILILL